MKFNYDNTKVGDVFVPSDDDIKDAKYHGKITQVSSWGVIMDSPWLTIMRENSLLWQELNDGGFKKPKSLNKHE